MTYLYKEIIKRGSLCGIILSSNYLGLEVHASDEAPSAHHNHHPDFLFNLSIPTKGSQQVPQLGGG